ncbi:phage terminase large subunit [Azospirillum sp. SYSU D00513]|uniref:phage terminase large subunit n=1 Tax=Azospirillum sp. SYSU D00513 TaxID=2812561 RepID=UPI001A971AC8
MSIYGAPDHPRGWPDQKNEWREFDRVLEERVTRLYAIAEDPKADQERAELIELLKRVTRVAGDPAGGGEMKDERAAFVNFCQVLKPVMGGWEDWGPIHEDILDALLSKDPNVVLLASRGSAKSTITSMFVSWRLWRNPLEVVLVVSSAESHAKRMLKAVRGFLDGCPLLEELRPDDEQLDSAFQLEVAPAKGKLGMSISLTCRGIGSQITGLRATLIIGDDIETPKDGTPEAVDKLEEALSELEFIASPGAQKKMLGTPQSTFSLYGRLKRSEAWTVFQACIFTSDIIDGEEVFESRWPARFSPENIAQTRKTVTKQLFALHYRLDLSDTVTKEQPLKLCELPVIDWPSLNPQAPIEITGGGPALVGLPRGSTQDGDEWHGVGSVSPDLAPYTQIVAAVDPASGLSGRDAIGLSIVGVTAGGRAVIRVATGVRGVSVQDAIERTASLIAQYGTNKLVIEESKASTFGMVLMNALQARGWPLIPEKRNTGNATKGRRIIEAISPALGSGKLYICRDVLTSETGPEFVNQYTGIAYDGRKLKNDDIIDALAYCLAEIGPVLSADSSQFVAGARVNVDELRRLPLRRQVLGEEELELFAEVDENEISIRLQLDRALEQQRTDQRYGQTDPTLQHRIDHLTRELAKFTTGYLGQLSNQARLARDIHLNRYEVRKQ